MDKTIDLKKTVYEICKDSPEVLQIMKELGFEQITNPGMLNTAGRFMTIPKGAAMKNIGMEKIKEEFKNRGYNVTD